MLTRKYWSEEALLEMLNEETEEKEDEGTEAGSEGASPEDVDLDSLSTEEKINFAKEVLQSIEGASDEAQSKIDEIIDMLGDIDLEKESDED